MASPAGNITFDDYLGLTACLFEWADSYDSKDWDRLRKCIAPELRVRPPSTHLPQSITTYPTPALAPPLRPSHNPNPVSSLLSRPVEGDDGDDAQAHHQTHIPHQIDYRSFLDKIWEAMPAEEFIAMISDKSVLGNPLLKTQHFIGGTRWEKVSDTEVIGHHQLRVPHQKYTDASRKTVAVKGHAHSYNMHWYKKVNGVWKFAGLNPEIRWSEYDFEAVFADGRDSFGEDEKSDVKVVEKELKSAVAH
ncbi:Scytalone dehydratase [Colletotrichum siamense]|nr:Scytalone dehydratase [Colletotrichum siamense]KAF4866245.1 Scytalone dehydratase [Colletotrichum siamense]